MLPIQAELRTYSSEARRRISMGFFKTGKGQYGEGDTFIGVTVPDTRGVAKKFPALPMKDVETLLHSPIHEERLLSLLLLVARYQKGDEKGKQAVYDFYLKNAPRVNNWDLVDLSAEKIVGPHLFARDRKILQRLAHSKSVWERRIAIVSTYHFIRANQFEDTFALCESLIHDPEDLIHKACGWMLREVGKRNENELHRFLKKQYHQMPRTMLRYAIEKFSPTERKKYLEGKM